VWHLLFKIEINIDDNDQFLFVLPFFSILWGIVVRRVPKFTAAKMRTLASPFSHAFDDLFSFNYCILT
jgi:hypothetical protein